MDQKAAVLALACALLVQAQPAARAAADMAATQRPKIGLVLGGGGARGAAHVGVLKVLEEMRIPVDCIAGTSMGSIVGGLYASGMSPAGIEREMRSMPWNELFQDQPPREDRSFRRKRDDDLYVWKAKPGLGADGLKVPLAVIHGQKFDLELNRLTQPVATIRDFDALPIPYRAVAADLETGQPVVLGKGSLPLSIRASMAVPGGFDPVIIDNRLLVDGGIANNVPVNVARELCGEALIVVDVGSGLLKREDIKSGLDVSAQLFNFLFALNTEPQLKSLGERDVLITPALGDIGGGSFGRVGEAIPIGEAAARAVTEKLRRYSLSSGEYTQHVAARGQPRTETPIVAFVRINNQSHVSDEVIASRITAQAGQPLDEARLRQDIGQLYGLDIFQSVRYALAEEEGKTGVVITAEEKSWGPGYLQPGISYSNNLEGGSTFNLGATFTLTQINRLNGEWRTGAQLTDEPSIYTEIYQPLDPAARYFTRGQISYGARNVNFFDDGNNVSQYRLTGHGLDLEVGREFGTWGQFTLGYRSSHGTGELTTGSPAPHFDFDSGEFVAGIFVDNFDNLYFPRAGNLGVATWLGSREGLGADANFDQAIFHYSQAYSLGKDTLIASLDWRQTLDDDAPIQSLFRTGGFLQLSGLQDNQLSGQHYGLGRLVYLRQIQDIQYLQAYLGGSLELGNVWQDKDDIGLDNTLIGASVFLGLDTPIGPLYFAYGRTDEDDDSLYVYLGPIWSGR
jgi:NTE family protein